MRDLGGFFGTILIGTALALLISCGGGDESPVAGGGTAGAAGADTTGSGGTPGTGGGVTGGQTGSGGAAGGTAGSGGEMGGTGGTDTGGAGGVAGIAGGTGGTDTGGAAGAAGFGGELVGDVTVERVATWKHDATAAYSIIHDDLCDGSTSGLELHWHELTDRGLRAGFGAIVAECDANQTYPFMLELVAAGHEIINHSYSHPDLTRNNVDLDSEIAAAGEQLEAQLGVTVEFLIFPFDAFDDTVFTYLQQLGYLGARGGVRGVNSADVDLGDSLADYRIAFDAYHPNQGNITIYTPATALPEHVDAAIASGGWSVRELHGIDDSSWGVVSLADYQEHLDYVLDRINEGALWMDTPSTVARYRRSRTHCGVPTAIDGVISFSADADCQRYATPLSVIVNTSAANISAYQDGASVPVEPLGGGQFIIDIDPAGGDTVVTAG